MKDNSKYSSTKLKAWDAMSDSNTGPSIAMEENAMKSISELASTMGKYEFP